MLSDSYGVNRERHEQGTGKPFGTRESWRLNTMVTDHFPPPTLTATRILSMRSSQTEAEKEGGGAEAGGRGENGGSGGGCDKRDWREQRDGGGCSR